jgi:hypothetical protein
LKRLTKIQPPIYFGVLAVAIPFFFYLVFPNQNFGWDASEYILRIDAGTANSLFHPHHLIYNAIGFGTLQMLKLLGLSINTAHLMQILNSIATAATLSIFYIVLLRFSTRTIIAAVFTLMFGFTNAVWEYTVEVEVYVVGLLFLTASLMLITKYLNKDTRPGSWEMIWLGVLGSLACLIHQMNILFVAVIVTFIFLTGHDFKSRAKMFAFYAMPMIVVVGGAYAAVGFALGLLPNIASFLNWMTMYFHVGDWGYFALNKFPIVAYALQKVFFKASFLRDWLITGHIEQSQIVFLILFTIGAVLLISLVVIFILKFRTILQSNRKLIPILIVWIFVYAIFIFWWDPLTHELWIPILSPLWLVLLLAFEKWKIKFSFKNTFIYSLVGLLLIVNFADILPNSKLENNEIYQLTVKINQQKINQDSLILIYGPVPVDHYYQLYFKTRLTVRSIDAMSSLTDKSKNDTFERLESTIGSTLAHGERVFVSANEIDPGTKESLAILGENRIIKVADHPEFYRQYQNRLFKVFDYQWRKQTISMYEILPLPQ